MKWIIHIDGKKCTGCKECMDNCPGEVFEMHNNISVPVRIDDCHGCHTCEDVCEEDAVTVLEGE